MIEYASIEYASTYASIFGEILVREFSFKVFNRYSYQEITRTKIVEQLEFK